MTSEEFKNAQSRLGLTNQQMADLLFGCSLSLIQHLRNGRRKVKPWHEEKIRRELIVSRSGGG